MYSEIRAFYHGAPDEDTARCRVLEDRLISTDSTWMEREQELLALLDQKGLL
ncbi:hypothetical protein JW921_08700 [Candidatus Fermentibacterales bacterium]|nr:hypothetical protein [Candidatus Fermentibacterales bacterium]